MASFVFSKLGEADERLTADRDEVKFLLNAPTAQVFARVFGQHLPRHRHRRGAVGKLPGAAHFVTTTYFDTASRESFEQAQGRGRSIKLRAKDYYDVHADLVELATDPDELVRSNEILWLEVKRRDGTRTQKRRLGIPKGDAPGFFAEGTVTPEMLRIQLELYGERAGDALGDLRALPGTFSSPMRADCLVNYRRSAWQSEDGALRVTLDSQLAFFTPPADLWERKGPLVRETLGSPVHEVQAHVLELKSRESVPDWLQALLEEHGCSPSLHSKFIEASKAVHHARGLEPNTRTA